MNSGILTCKLCGQLVDQLNHFYREHKLKLEEYLANYEKRVDLFDSSLIQYKGNIENYLLTDFNNKNNLKGWLKAQTLDEQKRYCRELLQKRKDKKQLRYAPTQVELRSILSPNIIFLDKIFKDEGGYYNICQQLGFIVKHKQQINKETKIVLGSEYQNGNYSILVDTREQSSLKLKDFPHEVRKLDFGDYGFSAPGKCGNIFVERKSISDFLSTLSSGYERFEREIQRAKMAGAYLIVLVEEPMTNALSFPYLPHVSKKIKITVDYLFHNVRELLQKYDNLQFAFCDGRRDMEEMIKTIFFSGGVFREIDLQLAIDLKIVGGETK